MILCDRLLSLSIELSRFIHIITFIYLISLSCNNILLYRSTTFYLSIHQLIYILLVLTLPYYKRSCVDCVLISLGHVSRSGITGSYDTICLNFGGNNKLFSKVDVTSYILQEVYKGSRFWQGKHFKIVPTVYMYQSQYPNSSHSLPFLLGIYVCIKQTAKGNILYSTGNST